VKAGPEIVFKGPVASWSGLRKHQELTQEKDQLARLAEMESG